MRVLCLFLAAVSLVAQTPPDGMALVPAGEFTMGAGGASTDESPPHRVFVSAFYIDVHEVTNAEFAGFVRRNGAFDRLDGPWFRYSAEGASDTVSHYEERYGVSLDGFNPDAGSEADRRSRYADMTRWRSATAALREFQAEPEDLEALIREQARLPVRGVTWRDAVAFAESCGKRLPTEAE
ncbi:MAG: formylglycine-generating enzyme family protein, partial [bacterium]|nr:formylglycine-generating enzyme family protein [bacterium]